MKRLRAFFAAIGERYDRVIVGVLLIAFVITLGAIIFQLFRTSGLEADVETQIARLTPAFPKADDVVLAPYKTALAQLQEPSQIAPDASELFVPEMRAWCVTCKRPISIVATHCPFCETEQPPDEDPMADTDADGLPDEWENTQGLDPLDPSDADRDADDDCFSNREEYEADPQTDPRDAASAPSIEAKLCLLKVEPRPFKFVLLGVSRGPDGKPIFQVNSIVNQQSYFKQLGDVIDGFKLVNFEDKSKWVTRRGMKIKVDVSELVLEKDGRSVRLVMGRRQMHLEYSALVHYLCDGSEHPVKRGDEVLLGGKAYRVIDIDTDPEPIVILRDTQKALLRIRGCK